MSCKFELSFVSDANGISLVRSVFTSRWGRDSFVCARGSTTASTKGVFKWSRAVQALCHLVCEYKIFSLFDVGELNRKQFISGEAGSAAATLDYALSKQPLWMLDMFGTGERGDPLIRRLFIRENPERKRPGPVSIYVNPNVLPPSGVEVILDGREITKLEDFISLANAIHDCLDGGAGRLFDGGSSMEVDDPKCNPTESSGPVGLNASAGIELNIFFEQMFADEALGMLRSTDIFRPKELACSLSRINANSSFRKVSGNPLLLSAGMESRLTSSQRIGSEEESFLDLQLKTDEPIRICTTFSLMSTILIVKYLQSVKGYNIDFNYNFAHTNEIVNRISESRFTQVPDLIVMGLAPAARLLDTSKHHSYLPLMIMPKVSNRMISRVEDKLDKRHLQDSCFVLPTDQPTTASFYFDYLCRRGLVDSRKARVIYCEPDEISSFLLPDNEDTHAILWFPHYHLSQILNGCTIDSLADNESTIGLDFETVMFAGSHFRAKTNQVIALSVAIRHAWLTLARGGSELHSMIKMLISDDDYMTFFRLCTGLQSHIWRNDWRMSQSGLYRH